MQEENAPRLRETIQIRKFDKTHDDDPKEPIAVTVSDRTYTKDRILVSSNVFDIPGWIGEWSLFNSGAQVIDAEKGVVRATPIRKKVALVGSQKEYIPSEPLNSKEWEVWGCNSLWKTTRDQQGRFRADRWFEMHPMSVQTKEEVRCIEECPVPIYVLDDSGDPLSNVDNAVRFPIERMKEIWPFDYFTCTFAYQVALAIVEGFTEIGIFGMELMFGSPRERLFERACLEFWLGVAYGKGITVHFHPQSRLCRHPFKYGYDYDQEKEYCNEKTTRLGMLDAREREQANIQFVTTGEMIAFMHAQDQHETEEFHNEESL